MYSVVTLYSVQPNQFMSGDELHGVVDIDAIDPLQELVAPDFPPRTAALALQFFFSDGRETDDGHSCSFSNHQSQCYSLNRLPCGAWETERTMSSLKPSCSHPNDTSLRTRVTEGRCLDANDSAALTVASVSWLAIVYFGAKFQHGPVAVRAGVAECSLMMSVIRQLRL